MKSLEYRRLLRSYQEWIQAMNYADSSTSRGPNKIREFFMWLVTEKKIEVIEKITDEVVRHYFDYLKNRISERTGRGLSLNYIRTHQVELKRFSRYLSETNQGHIEVSIELKSKGSSI